MYITWDDLQQHFLLQKHCCDIVLNGCNIIPGLLCHKLPLRIVLCSITFISHYTIGFQHRLKSSQELPVEIISMSISLALFSQFIYDITCLLYLFLFIYFFSFIIKRHMRIKSLELYWITSFSLKKMSTFFIK